MKVISAIFSLLLTILLVALAPLPAEAAPIETPCEVRLWNSDKFLFEGSFTWKYADAPVKEYFEFKCYRQAQGLFECSGTSIRLGNIEENNELSWTDISHIENGVGTLGGGFASVVRVAWGDYTFVFSDGGQSIQGTASHHQEGLMTSTCTVTEKIRFKR
jgi:hypothetical protein